MQRSSLQRAKVEFQSVDQWKFPSGWQFYCLQVKPGFHMIARSRKESQRVAIKVVKFACDSLRSYGNRLKLCLRLLATPCDSLRLLAIAVAGSRRHRKFSISATHCDSLRSIAINGNHCSQLLQLLAITTLLFQGIISLP